MIHKVVVDFQEVCKSTKMTAVKDWQFLCASHPKPIDCLAIDYAYHTLDTIQCLITNPSFYPSREHLPDKELFISRFPDPYFGSPHFAVPKPRFLPAYITVHIVHAR
jgi:hypothetical protein